MTYTTDYRYTSEAQWRCKLACLSLNLLGKLTRRGEDECIGTEVAVLVREKWHVGDKGEHRDDEGCCFSGTCCDVST